MNVPVNLQKAKCGSRPHFAFLLSEIKFDGIFANVKKTTLKCPRAVRVIQSGKIPS
jgi:hypothetical protein